MGEAEDKEKAEKLAAAKKRYEQLKKKKGTGEAKSKKGGKATKQDKDETKSEKQTQSDDPKEGDKDDNNNDDDDNENGDDPNNDDEASEDELKTAGASKKSDSLQDLYKRQRERIEELEQRNKELQHDVADKAKHISNKDGQLEDLQNERENLQELRGQASKLENSEKEVERLKAELVALQRQNTTLQTQRRKSAATSPPAGSLANVEDLQSQLQAKTGAVESLELEMSNLRHALSTSESKATDLAAKLDSAESRGKATEEQLADLRRTLEEQTSSEEAESKDATTRAKEAETRLALVSSDLAASQKSAADAAVRAEHLQKKVDALTGLHKEAEGRHQIQGKKQLSELEKTRDEAADLRRRLNTLTTENVTLKKASVSRKSVDGDSGGVEELEDEERNALLNRVRELESEVYELKRGIWKDRRQQMQPGPDGEADTAVTSPSGIFDDVDLGGSGNPFDAQSRRMSSSYGGAFSSVINAFTGGSQPPRRHSNKQKTGAELGFLPDDEEDDFDEAAFAQAQQDEAKARLERVRNIKRGLVQWKSYRVNLVDLRGGAAAGVFDV